MAFGDLLQECGYDEEVLQQYEEVADVEVCSHVQTKLPLECILERHHCAAIENTRPVLVATQTSAILCLPNNAPIVCLDKL
jgi:hypothetical protein